MGEHFFEATQTTSSQSAGAACREQIKRVKSHVPTYIYETTDATKPIRELEVKQSVHDEPLRVDPETGEAVRRIISAGYSILMRGGSTGPSVGSCG